MRKRHHGRCTWLCYLLDGGDKAQPRQWVNRLSSTTWERRCRRDTWPCYCNNTRDRARPLEWVRRLNLTVWKGWCGKKAQLCKSVTSLTMQNRWCVSSYNWSRCWDNMRDKTRSCEWVWRLSSTMRKEKCGRHTRLCCYNVTGDKIQLCECCF